MAPLPEVLSLPGRDGAPLVAKNAVGFAYNGGNLADCLEAVGAGWRLAAPHLLEASRQLDTAIAVADDTPVGYAYWWNGTAKPLSRREHLRRHRIYTEFTGFLGHEIGLHFALHGRFERLGRDPEAYLAEAGPLLQEDLDACRRIVAFIDALIRDYPTAERLPARRWRDDYARKVAALEAHLRP